MLCETVYSTWTSAITELTFHRSLDPAAVPLAAVRDLIANRGDRSKAIQKTACGGEGGSAMTSQGKHLWTDKSVSKKQNIVVLRLTEKRRSINQAYETAGNILRLALKYRNNHTCPPSSGPVVQKKYENYPKTTENNSKFRIQIWTASRAFIVEQ